MTVTKPAATASSALAPMLTLPVVEAPDDVTRVTDAIAAGTLHATVTVTETETETETRKFPGCSQSRAMPVRKQLELSTLQS